MKATDRQQKDARATDTCHVVVSRLGADCPSSCPSCSGTDRIESLRCVNCHKCAPVSCSTRLILCKWTVPPNIAPCSPSSAEHFGCFRLRTLWLNRLLRHKSVACGDAQMRTVRTGGPQCISFDAVPLMPSPWSLCCSANIWQAMKHLIIHVG